jgi:hypothetical protein
LLSNLENLSFSLSLSENPISDELSIKKATCASVFCSIYFHFLNRQNIFCSLCCIHLYTMSLHVCNGNNFLAFAIYTFIFHSMPKNIFFREKDFCFESFFAPSRVARWHIFKPKS